MYTDGLFESVFIVEVMKKVSASVKSSKINFGKPTGGVAMVAAAVDHPFRHFEANSINSTVAMVPFTAGMFSTTIGGYVKYLSNFSDNWWNHLRELYDFEPTIPLHPLTLQIHWDLDGAAFTYLLVQSKPTPCKEQHRLAGSRPVYGFPRWQAQQAKINNQQTGPRVSEAPAQRKKGPSKPLKRKHAIIESDAEEDNADTTEVSVKHPKKKKKVKDTPRPASVQVINVDDNNDSDSEDNVKTSKVEPKKAETPKEILERHLKGWKSPIYGFYEKPFYEECGPLKQPTHTFRCTACKLDVRRYQDTADANSLSNLRKHVIHCCGGQAVKAIIDSGETPDKVQAKVGDKKGVNLDIKGLFDNQRKADHEHSSMIKALTKDIVLNVSAGSPRITRCPHYWLPHPMVVLRDTKTAFAQTRKRILKMLCEYQGDIHFTTDAWTSGNHKSFVAITAHIILKGQQTTILLDFLELAKSHTGITLTQEFAKVLKAFGIGNKILCITGDNATNNDAMIDPLPLLKTYPRQKHHLFDSSKEEDQDNIIWKLAEGQDISDELELDEVEVRTLRQELAKFEKDKKSQRKSNETEDDIEEEEVLDAKSLLDNVEAVDLKTEIVPI
ncbi:hypothetical protein VNI00_018991 [Paramarasmius palmivorus]|uniref:Uncharacterized protein n=1 Tax=Paramarasmius palmivorus TaxID=297713 RepID=A0AAW0ASE4_9AGAR